MVGQNKVMLEIVSPLYSNKIEVEWVEIEGESGSFTVGPGHDSLVSIIRKKAVITYKLPKNKEVICLDISEGFFSVENDYAVILLPK